MRGRKPAPTALKVLAGVRSDRIPDDAPEAVSGRPEAPSHLDDVAREEWERMVEDLDALGVLSRTDGSALAIYCVAFSRWVKARAEVDEKGMVLETRLGGLKKNPAVTIAESAEGIMSRLLGEFGCSPSSRSRVNPVHADGPKDELGDFLAAAPSRQAR